MPVSRWKGNFGESALEIPLFSQFRIYLNFFQKKKIFRTIWMAFGIVRVTCAVLLVWSRVIWDAIRSKHNLTSSITKDWNRWEKNLGSLKLMLQRTMRHAHKSQIYCFSPVTFNQLSYQPEYLWFRPECCSRVQNEQKHRILSPKYSRWFVVLNKESHAKCHSFYGKRNRIGWLSLKIYAPKNYILIPKNLHHSELRNPKRCECVEISNDFVHFEKNIFGLWSRTNLRLKNNVKFLQHFK